MNDKRLYYAVLVSVLLIILSALPVPLVINAAKYAEVGREILMNKDWINLTIGGDAYDQKPPFYDEFIFHYELFNFHHWWVEGKLQPTYVAGIGCALMKKKLLENIEFRWDKNNPSSNPPDTYFADDLRALGIQNWVHTGVLCFHWNQEEWGRHFELIKYEKSE